jgi:hypothetical protein
MTTRASILAVTAIAALGSSFLVPGDAFASSRGFAHAAQVSRSVHVSTGSVHTASVGFHRSTGFQRPVSSGKVASGSFTQRRFGSATTANRTFGHTNTPQFNTLATNGAQLNTTHLADKCSGVGAPATCFLNQGKGVGGTGGSAAALGAKTTTNIGSPVLVPVTEPAIPSGTKGSGGNTNANNTPGNTKTPTGGGGTGTGGNTNANNTPGNGNNTTGGGNHPNTGSGGHQFPGHFPVAVGPGHGPFVGGPVGGAVAVGGSIAPVAVGPVASARGALPPVTAPSAPRPPAPNCLTKDYLQTGVVMFRDLCNQEWAINNSSVTNTAPTNSACLSKENPQNGVVLFKDNCTSEWAMNPQPADNQAQPN